MGDIIPFDEMRRAFWNQRWLLLPQPGPVHQGDSRPALESGHGRRALGQETGGTPKLLAEDGSALHFGVEETCKLSQMALVLARQSLKNPMARFSTCSVGGHRKAGSGRSQHTL